MKVENTIVTKEQKTIEKVGMRLKFEGNAIQLDVANAIQLDVEQIEKKWKLAWKREKRVLQRCNEQMRIQTYQPKDQQSRFFRDQEEECHLWVTQNLHPLENIIYHINVETDDRK